MIKISKCNITKDSLNSFIAVVITVLWYGAERVAEVFFELSKSQLIGLAAASTVMIAVVYYLISVTKTAYSGMLASMIAFKMMPPLITFAQNSNDAQFLYYIVSKVAIVLFVFQFIKHFTRQETKNISAVSAFIIAASVPFLMPIAQTTGRYLVLSMKMNGVWTYFCQFACYGLCMLIAWMLAVRSDYEELKFIVNYEFVVLGINILRKGSLICLNLINGVHVSLSLYCWVIIFAIGILLFYFTYKMRKKEILKVV